MLSRSHRITSDRPYKHAHKHGLGRNWFVLMLTGGCAITTLGLMLLSGIDQEAKRLPTITFRKGSLTYPYHASNLPSKHLNREERANKQTEFLALKTDLYDLHGNLLGSFAGEFQDTTPNGQSVVTFVRSENRSYVFSLDGRKSKRLEGIFRGFTPSNQHIITHSQNQSHLYDLDGTWLMSLDGFLK